MNAGEIVIAVAFLLGVIWESNEIATLPGLSEGGILGPAARMLAVAVVAIIVLLFASFRFRE